MPARLALRRRARLPVPQKVRIAIGLYEAVRATGPDWSNEAVRRADLATHRRVRALLDAAAQVHCRSDALRPSSGARRAEARVVRLRSAGRRGAWRAPRNTGIDVTVQVERARLGALVEALESEGLRH